MTADAELPIYVVQGANWNVEIQLDEDDNELDKLEQMMEAATKGCEYAHGIVEDGNSTYQAFDDGPPYFGAVLLVHVKGTDPNKTQEMIPAYIALANGGFYNDSRDAHHILQQELKVLQDARDIKAVEAIANFEKLQAEVKAEEAPKKRKRKKKE
jgi:hypothetical protein